MTFTDVVKSVPGLTHYYPLTTDAKDAVGSQHGTASGVSFTNGKAVFAGAGKIDLGDHNDFSVATKKALTICMAVAITDWHGKGASEYVHWAGKGSPDKHEWTFRHYVKDGTGEASTRQGRMSTYHYNPSGHLGAGSYYQDSTFPTNERFVVMTCDMGTISLWVDGVKRDSDPLSGYNVVPQNTTSSACLGTRGDGTGFLVGSLRRVGFFNRILSPTEILALYAARAQSDTAPPPVVVDPPPVVVTPTPPPTDPLVVRSNATGSEIIDAHNALVAALRGKGSL